MGGGQILPKLPVSVILIPIPGRGLINTSRIRYAPHNLYGNIEDCLLRDSNALVLFSELMS